MTEQENKDKFYKNSRPMVEKVQSILEETGEVFVKIFWQAEKHTIQWQAIDSEEFYKQYREK